jgi:transposase-like protein
MTGDYPWRDEDTLRRMYVEEGMSMADIGDELGCSDQTISDWLQRLGINARDTGGQYPDDCPWRDENVLRDMYVEKEMSTHDIADQLGCSPPTVFNWLQKHEIETRSRGNNYVGHYFDKRGYEVWRCQSGRCSVHQLLVIAHGADPHVVFDQDHEIHHKSGQPLQNTPQNLEVKTVAEHRREHKQLDCKPSREELYRMYAEEEMSTYNISDQLGCSRQTISNWLDKHNIERRGPGPESSVGDD